MTKIPALSTPRLSIEALDQTHFSEMHELHSDPKFMRYLGGIRTQAQTQEYLDRNLAHWARRGFGICVLRTADTGEFVGRSGLRELELQGEFEIEIAWGLRPKFWGQGLATEIALKCVDVAREDLKCASIVATIRPDNVASRRLAKRVGMEFEREVEAHEKTLDLFRLDLHSPYNSRQDPTARLRRPARQPPLRSMNEENL